MPMVVDTTIMSIWRRGGPCQKTIKVKKQKKIKGPKFTALVVSVGKAKRHCQIFATTAHTPAAVGVLKFELVAEEIVHAEDVQIHLGKVKLVMPRWSAHHENDESLIFKTRSNLTHKPTLMKRENHSAKGH